MNEEMNGEMIGATVEAVAGTSGAQVGIHAETIGIGTETDTAAQSFMMMTMQESVQEISSSTLRRRRTTTTTRHIGTRATRAKVATMTRL